MNRKEALLFLGLIGVGPYCVPEDLESCRIASMRSPYIGSELIAPTLGAIKCDGGEIPSLVVAWKAADNNVARLANIGSLDVISDFAMKDEVGRFPRRCIFLRGMNRCEQGLLAIVFGPSAKSSTTTARVIVLDLSKSQKIVDLEGSPSFGSSVASIHDQDGDGIEDILIGDPEYTSENSSPARAGAVLLVSSKTGRTLRVIRGEHRGDQFGHSVCDVGDIDLDGIDDFAVGAPGVEALGYVDVLSGATFVRIAVIPGDLKVGRIGFWVGFGRFCTQVGLNAIVIPAENALLISQDPREQPRIIYPTWRWEGQELIECGDYDGDGVSDFVIAENEKSSTLLFDTGAQYLTIYSGGSGYILRRRAIGDISLWPRQFVIGRDSDGGGDNDIIISFPGHVDLVSFERFFRSKR